MDDLRDIIDARNDAIIRSGDIRSKLSFLDFLEQSYANSQPIIKRKILMSLFTLARDFYPLVRRKSLDIIGSTTQIPTDILIQSLIKSLTTGPRLIRDKPYAGTIGMCLEDGIPEIRTAAIHAITVSVKPSEASSSTEIIQVLTQKLGDSSPKVRSAAMTSLRVVSSTFGSYFTLDINHLKVVLSVLSEASDTDRFESILLVQRILLVDQSEVDTVIFYLSSAAEKFPAQANDFTKAAFSFGSNNYDFMRKFAIEFFSISRHISSLTIPSSLIPVVACFASYLRSPFPLPPLAVRHMRLLIPMLKRIGENPSNPTSLDTEKLLQFKDELSLQYIEKCMPKEKEALDFISGRVPKYCFRAVEGEQIRRYHAKILSPLPNTMESAAKFTGSEIFFFVQAVVEPSSDENICFSIKKPSEPPQIFPMVKRRDILFEANPQVSIKYVYPSLEVVIEIVIQDPNSERVVTISDKAVEFWIQNA